jgi:hypothetical protein
MLTDALTIIKPAREQHFVAPAGNDHKEPAFDSVVAWESTRMKFDLTWPCVAAAARGDAALCLRRQRPWRAILVQATATFS